MALKLMYITNDPQVALIAEKTGVDRIFIDMEYIGKADRQGGMDTVQSHHTIEDIRSVRKVLTTAEVLVRVNPIHEAGSYLGIPHDSSKEEINAAIEAGADVLMLPYFKTVYEVKTFLTIVNGRVTTQLLVETAEAVELLDEILELPGIDEIHIGLNDLNLARGGVFMFRLMNDGTVEAIAEKCKAHRIPFGIGGIAGLGQGLLPAEYIVGEHYRLGSEAAILSRSFCNTAVVTDLREIEDIFRDGVKGIRELEETLREHKANQDEEFFRQNRREFDAGIVRVEEVINRNRSRK